MITSHYGGKVVLIGGKVMVDGDSNLWHAQVPSFCVRAEGATSEEAMMNLGKAIRSCEPRFDFRFLWLKESDRFAVQTSDVREVQAFMLLRSREAAGLSARGLAQKLNRSSRSTIFQYEAGEREPSMTLLLERLEASGRIPLFTTISEDELGPAVFDAGSTAGEQDEDEAWDAEGSVAEREAWDSWIRSYSMPEEFWWAFFLREIGKTGKETLTREEIAEFLVAELKATGRDSKFLGEKLEEKRRLKAQELKMCGDAEWERKSIAWARKHYEHMNLGKLLNAAVIHLLKRTQCPVERFDRRSGPAIPYFSAKRLIQLGMKVS